MLVGLVGKPNVGKSTFFAAATMAPAEIANYPFTTIEPNRGVAYLRAPCPHVALGFPSCSPRAGACRDGTRWVPTQLLDVAGLVPDAHAGKGLGNRFLDDLRQADLLLHVVDATGATDAEGNPVAAGTRDPRDDVAFLEREIDHWIAGIVTKGFDRAAKAIVMKGEKVERVLAERLTGLGIGEHEIAHAVRAADMPAQPTSWTDEDAVRLAREVRRVAKPILVALNKADALPPGKPLPRIDGVTAVPTSASAELALRKASDAGVLRYAPGDSDFTILDDAKLNDAQRKGLEYVREHVLKRFGGTGVQRMIETAVYQLLDRVVVYPVENETHATDKDGNVLPDAHLLRRGATAKELAYKVHTDLGDHFIRAVNVKTKRVVGADHVLEDGDVMRIVAGK